MNGRVRGSQTLTVLAVAALVATAPAAHAGRAPRASSSAAAPSLTEVGNGFEQNRLLAGAERLAALQQTQESVAQVLHGGLDGEQRTAARFLSGAVQYELGNFGKAAEEFGQAADGGDKNAFADDAAFAAIQALEADGRDGEAAREWTKWEKRFPRVR